MLIPIDSFGFRFMLIPIDSFGFRFRLIPIDSFGFRFMSIPLDFCLAAALSSDDSHALESGMNGDLE